MLKRLIAMLWRGSPPFIRRWSVALWQSRFTVTAGAVVCDETGRVLLLRHVFRKGTGWGIPGGFIAPGEQPEQAVRREMKEETGLDLESVELALVRTLHQVRQVEIIFRCRLDASALQRRSDSFEVDRAEWFDRASLPEGLSTDQRRLIDRALG